MKHKVSELSGEALNLAVHMALEASGQEVLTPGFPQFIPYSTSWERGGPIIERERIQLDNVKDSDAPASERKYFWMATIYSPFWEPVRTDVYGNGDTPLVAAMRAFVASKFGDEVELP